MLKSLLPLPQLPAFRDAFLVFAGRNKWRKRNARVSFPEHVLPRVAQSWTRTFSSAGVVGALVFDAVSQKLRFGVAVWRGGRVVTHEFTEQQAGGVGRENHGLRLSVHGEQLVLLQRGVSAMPLWRVNLRTWELIPSGVLDVLGALRRVAQEQADVASAYRGLADGRQWSVSEWAWADAETLVVVAQRPSLTLRSVDVSVGSELVAEARVDWTGRGRVAHVRILPLGPLYMPGRSSMSAVVVARTLYVHRALNVRTMQHARDATTGTLAFSALVYTVDLDAGVARAPVEQRRYVRGQPLVRTADDIEREWVSAQTHVFVPVCGGRVLSAYPKLNIVAYESDTELVDFAAGLSASETRETWAPLPGAGLVRVDADRGTVSLRVARFAGPWCAPLGGEEPGSARAVDCGGGAAGAFVPPESAFWGAGARDEEQ